MKRLILVFSFLIIIGCVRSNNVQYPIILGSVKEVFKPMLIEKAIVLESTSSNLLGTFLNVKYDQESFWILDLDNRDAIHGFDEKGKYLGFVGEVGEGPNRVLNLSDFLLLDSSILTLSTFGNEVEFSNYSFNNELNSKKRIDFNLYSFEQAKLGYWIYSGYNKEAGVYRLKLISKEGEFKKEFIKNSFNENILPMLEPVFFKGENDVLFRETLKSSIYTLSDSGPIEKYKFDFGSLQVPESFWEMDTFEGFEMINRQGFANINFIFETKTHLLVDVLIQNESGVKKEIVILNKAKNEWVKIKVDEENSGYFYTPIGLSDDQIIFISYAPYVVRNLDKLTLSNNAKNSLNSMTEESNPVILYAKIPD